MYQDYIYTQTRQKRSLNNLAYQRFVSGPSISLETRKFIDQSRKKSEWNAVILIRRARN